MHLSVVIPFAGGDLPLVRTLESLLTQEHPLPEILVACPPGEPVSLAAVKMLSPRFEGSLRRVEAPPNLTTVELWNFAAAAATGKWISLLTPQVAVRSHFTRALSESAERCPTAAVIRAGWTRERSRGGPSEQHTLLSVRTVTHPAEALYEQRFGPKASTAAAAIRRETWQQMGGLPAEISLLGDWIGDWALWLTAGACADTVRSPEVIADIHTGLPDTDKAQEMREMYLIYRDILPRAADRAQLPDPTWISAASRKRFRDVTIAASNELRPQRGPERNHLADALDPWARAVDQQPLLERLRAGEKIRSFTLGKKMRPALRRVIAAVR